jgi:hypothetical protein
LPKGQYDADDVIWACDVYHDLVELKARSDKLMAQVQGGSLSADKQALVDKAKQYYGWFDYLDSYRLLRAAAQ